MVKMQSDYNIPSLVVTNLVEMKIKWDKLVLICDTVSTKGKGATANRNKYQPKYSNALESAISLYLLSNADVSAPDLLSFHISLPSKNRKPTPAATSTIVAKVKYKEPLAHYFGFTDSKTGKLAKPKGVAFIELRYTVALQQPLSIADCNERVYMSRKIRKVAFKASDVCKKAYYYGRYVSKTGKCGPWCAMFSAVIA
jgi:hypothetical protein